MPYLRLDLDAKGNCHHVAAACGTDAKTVLWGLTQLWEWCWREQVAEVTSSQIPAFFGLRTPELAQALQDFGFITIVSNDCIRVRGAETYLKVTEQRSEAGKKGSRAVARGTGGRFRKAKKQPSTTVEPPSDDGRPADGAPTAHGPLQHSAFSIQHSAKEIAGEPAPEPLKLVPQEPKAKPKPDPDLERRRALKAKLEGVYLETMGEPYAGTEKADNPALKLLADKFHDAVIEARWVAALRTEGWGSVRTIAQLRSKWTEHAKPKPAQSGLRKLAPGEMP